MAWFWVILLFLPIILLVLQKKKEGAQKSQKLPPGPLGWPLVGNLFQLGKKPNESLLHLAKKYGPLMTLRLGMKTAVVVSSPAMAKEILKNNDQIFAGRIVIQAAKCFSYHENSIIWCQYGPRWRMLRKIFSNELFGPKRLEMSRALRRHQTDKMIRVIYQKMGSADGVDIGQVVFFISMNLLGHMMFGKDMFDDADSEKTQEFKDLIWRMMELGGMSNLADFFPALEWVDPQSISRRIEPCIVKIYALFDHFIQERIQDQHLQRNSDHQQEERHQDFLDILLSLSRAGDAAGYDLFNLNAIKSLFLDIFQAGPHVTATTIEWAMAELLANPRVLAKTQQELTEQVGLARPVSEDDIENLPYLNALIKEVLRLHPPAPLLSNRADDSCTVAGFHIPKNTQTIINVWALGRDPASWPNPAQFLPERFLSGGGNALLDYKGHHFELIPFGAGRRICPGLPFAHRMLHLAVARLVHSFNWSVVGGRVDMSDKFGLSLQKAVPLKAFPSPRLPASLYSV